MRRIGIVMVLVLAACAEQTQQQTTPPAQEPEAEPQAQEIQVIATEYAFDGIPETMEPGEATFTMVNEGQEQHEMVLIKITDDRPMEELIRLPQQEVQGVQRAGRTFAKPGKSKSFSRELESGRYAYVCFITTEDGTPHAFEGMFGDFTVA